MFQGSGLGLGRVQGVGESADSVDRIFLRL